MMKRDSAVLHRNPKGLSWSKQPGGAGWFEVFAAILAVLLLVASGGALSMSVEAATPDGRAGFADELKQFMENPPCIERILYVQEVPNDPKNPDSMDFFQFQLRWQTNGVFFAQAYTNLVAGHEDGDLLKYKDVFGNYEKRYGRKTAANFYEWTDTGKSDEHGNSLQQYRQTVLSAFTADMLNAGCHLVPVHSIHWNGDEFVVTNEEQGIWATGRLFRDANNRASKMTVEARSLARAGAHESWVYEYSYERPLSLPYYPSRILAFSSENGGATNLISRFNIESMAIADKPQPASAFLIPDDVATNAMVAHVVISNRFLVYDQGGRRFKLADGPAASEARKLTRGVYFVVAGVLFAPFLIFFLGRKKEAAGLNANKQTQ